MTHANGTPRPAPPLRPGDFLTTGQVAKAIGVATRTATKWADAGHFPGMWRIPDSGDRRIPLGDAVAFCQRVGCSVPRDWLEARPVLLFVGLEPPPGIPDDYCVRSVPNGFEAGIVVQADGVFAGVIVDAAALGSDVALGLLAAMRRHPRLAGVPIAVSVAEDDDGSRWAAVADRVLRGPVVAGEVAGVVGGRP